MDRGGLVGRCRLELVRVAMRILARSEAVGQLWAAMVRLCRLGMDRQLDKQRTTRHLQCKRLRSIMDSRPRLVQRRLQLSLQILTQHFHSRQLPQQRLSSSTKPTSLG